MVLLSTARKCGYSFATFTPLLALFTVFKLLLLFVIISGDYKILSLNLQLSHLGASLQGEDTVKDPLTDHHTLNTDEVSKDKLLNSLLSPSFDEASCYSRYHSGSYWKPSPHTPSPHLLRKLRNYEKLHQKCGPMTQHYKQSLQQLRTNHNITTECNYLVWIPVDDGLGNKLIALISAFLYALLTNKVLLYYIPDEMRNLFCEPFPNSSWVLPSNFPVHDYSYGKTAFRNSSHPAFRYVYLGNYNYSESYKMFFCDDSQPLLDRLPWLIMMSNRYFAPGLFLMERYEKELDSLFPEKDSVFHHLSRYLLHPSNAVWGYITRYYNAYLASAQERIGIQIRMKRTSPLLPVPSLDDILDQVINCTIENKILPDIDHNKNVPLLSRIMPESRPVSVLVTSLDSRYYERLSEMYYEHSTVTGEAIGFYQPSHEGVQKTQQVSHNMKALADIFLLSFSDKLVTSSLSTFGYVAHSLGGLRPWILQIAKNTRPACSFDILIEPCFNCGQYWYDCKLVSEIDKVLVVPHVRHCIDIPNGIKLHYSRKKNIEESI